MLLDLARDTIQRHCMLERGQRVLIAVSGGPDSVALLDVLARLAPEFDLGLHVAHLNHMLRPEAAAEAEFVRSLGQQFGLQVTIGSADVPALAANRKLSIEYAARNARRAFLLDAAEDTQADRIALGHHRDDQVETVLMRILRGTGVDGLAGMRPVARSFIRPLFDASRAQILAYVSERGLPFREDPSNRDPAFLRNRIRAELLPLIEDVQPGARTAILRLSELAAQDARALNAQASKLLAKATVAREPHAITLRLASLSRAELPIERRVLREAIRLLLGDTMDIQQGHVEAALDLAACGRTGARLSLPRSVVVERGYGMLILRVGEPEPTGPIGEFALTAPGRTEIAPLGVAITADVLPRSQALPVIEEPPNAAQLDRAVVPEPLLVRTWRRGDRFTPFGMTGTMKLHDFFVNEKIPRAERHRVPIVAAGSVIAWVAGRRIDDRFKVTAATETVLRLEVTPV
jgi:tRNA(Ile)-lysidine synthase